MNGEMIERKAEIERQIDEMEQTVAAVASRPWTAAAALPSIVAELIDVLRGTLELIRED